MQCLKTKVQTFEIIHGRVPTVEEGLQVLVSNPSNLPRWKKLMNEIPLDPWGHPYQYVIAPVSKRHDSFGIYSFGPDGISRSGGNDSDDVRSW